MSHPMDRALYDQMSGSRYLFESVGIYLTGGKLIPKTLHYAEPYHRRDTEVHLTYTCRRCKEDRSIVFDISYDDLRYRRGSPQEEMTDLFAKFLLEHVREHMDCTFKTERQFIKEMGYTEKFKAWQKFRK